MCVFDGPRPSNDPWQRFASINPAAGDLKDDPAGWTRKAQLMERDGYEEMYNLVARNYAVAPNALPEESTVESKRWAMLGTKDARYVCFKSSYRMFLNLLPSGRFGCIMVNKYTRPLIDAVAKEAKECRDSLTDLLPVLTGPCRKQQRV